MPPVRAFSARLRRAAAVLTLSVLAAAGPVHAQDDEGGDILTDLDLAASLDSFREPDLDDDPLAISVLFTMDGEALAEHLAGRTQYTVEYGFYNQTAECGKDFVFVPPDGTRPGCPADGAVQDYSSAVLGGRIEMIRIIPDTEPEADEVVRLWVGLLGLPASRKEVDVTIANNVPAVHFLDVVTLEFNLLGGAADPTVPAGSTLAYEVVLSENYPDAEVKVVVSTLAGFGTAVPGTDYSPVSVGNIVVVPPGADRSSVGTIQTLRRATPNLPTSTFIVQVEATYDHHPRRYSLNRYSVSITDPRAGNTNASVFPGASPNEIFLVPASRAFTSCARSPRDSIVFIAPPEGSEPLQYSVEFVYVRLLADGGCDLVDPQQHLPVGVYIAPDYGPSAGTAARGRDFNVTPRNADFPRNALKFEVHPRTGAAGPRTATLVLDAGLYDFAQFPVVVLSQDDAVYFAGSSEAAYAAVAREAGGLIVDAVSRRFSCAAAGRCGGGIAAASDAVDGFGRALRSAVSPLAVPGAFGAGAPYPASAAGGLQLLGAFGPGSGPGGGAGSFDADGFGSTRIRSMSAADAAVRAVRSFGRGLSLQRTFGGPRTLTTGSGPAWSAWFGASSRSASVSVPGAVGRDTSLTALSGGVDRKSGRAVVGAAYTLLRGSSAPRGAGAAGRDFSGSATWHVVTPYAGYSLRPRVRVWGAAGLPIAVTGGSPGIGSTWWLDSDQRRNYSVEPQDRTPVPGLGFRAAGASVTALKTSGLVLDVEIDTFSAAASVPAGLSDDSPASAAASYWAVAAFQDGHGAGALPSWTGRRSVRHRAGVRAAVPFAAASRFIGRTSVRWDSGPDLDSVLSAGGAARSVDAGVSLSLAPRRSALSLLLRYQFELLSALRGVRGAETSRQAFDAAFRFGAAESSTGWSVEIAPAYGYPVMRSLTGSGSLGRPAPAVAALSPPVPLVAVDAAYRFPDSSAFVFSAHRPFADVPADGTPVFLQPGPAVSAGYRRAW